MFSVLALGCVVWCCASSLLAHPDYLAYFNEIASRHPERFRVDSDLDWGQDLGRLSTRLRALHAPSVALSYFGSADLTRFNLPPVHDVSCEGDFHGYVAVSATMLYLGGPLWSKCPQRFAELARTQPLERVGRSIYLYYFPAGNACFKPPAPELSHSGRTPIGASLDAAWRAIAIVYS